MKILLKTDCLNQIKNSGIGRATTHQQKALELNNINYTTNVNDYFDILHINTIFPKSIKLIKKAKKNNKKIIIHAHSTVEDFKKSFVFSNLMAPIFKKWLIYSYNKADIIITPTLYSKKLIENYNIKKEIVVISNGIELNFLEQSSKDMNTFKEEFNISKEDKVIISVGLYIERKGILDFVKLAKLHPEYKFIWFGYTNLNVIPKKIKKAVLTKLDNLVFPGYYPREKLITAYATADLFLFPTYEETEGIVILEALASKINILVRDIPIYKDWLIKDIDVYKASTIEEFSIQLTNILENKLPNLTDNAYNKLNDLSIENIGIKLKETYCNLYNKKNQISKK